MIHSEWAVVAVPKANGQVDLCGDFMVTIIQALNVDQYHLSTALDVYVTLTSGKNFSKLFELHPE